MRLSLTAEYALRAMVVLATLAPGERRRATDLAREAGIPPHYLSKLLRRLAEAGLLDARKGHQGGYRFARPPGEVRYIEVLAAVDDVAESDHCAFGWRACDSRNPCPLHPAYSALKEALEAWAAATSFAGAGGTAGPPPRPAG
jgi:Rrf2 family protein